MKIGLLTSTVPELKSFIYVGKSGYLQWFVISCEQQTSGRRLRFEASNVKVNSVYH
jgi:hypothetical protein